MCTFQRINFIRWQFSSVVVDVGRETISVSLFTFCLIFTVFYILSGPNILLSYIIKFHHINLSILCNFFLLLLFLLFPH